MNNIEITKWITGIKTFEDAEKELNDMGYPIAIKCNG